jgi:hypothetical protein
VSREIPPRWLDAVRQHIRAGTGEERDHLLAFDFPPGQSIRLAFPDGSYAYFRDAFHLRDREGREVAVFTEHCGYHFFPASDLEIEILKSVGVEWPDEDEPPVQH